MPSPPTLKVASISMSFQIRSILIVSGPLRHPFCQRGSPTNAGNAAPGGAIMQHSKPPFNIT
jgi:hypothetical protein